MRVGALVEPIEFDIFYDYGCPFVYRVAQMLETVARSGERPLKPAWRYFSLTQVNSRDEGWTVWGAPATEPVKGRLAFMAAEAARRQQAFPALHLALLHARHRDLRDIDDPEVVAEVAAEAGLDRERFRRDLADRGTLEALARDHQDARAAHGVFGTPTFVFDNGGAAYVRLAQAPAPADAVRVFDRIVAIAAGEADILEIKRPRRPSPD
jgi:predicted DsbA family dithiol-disulfide isomerase